MKTVRVFWWRHKEGEGNFGDELGPAIVRVLARARVVWSPVNQADIVSIGSVLEPWFWNPESPSDFSGVIWGSGRMYGVEPLELPANQVALVRGPHTLGRLPGLNVNPIPTGDPGLLAELFVTKTDKKYSLGLVPHWSQASLPIWEQIASQNRNIKVINPCSGYEKVINEIAQCDTIASSSLHGLIVADALSIPSAWVSLRDASLPKESNVPFKFADYYASLGIHSAAPIELSESTLASSLAQSAWNEGVKNVSQITQKILDSFPV